MLVLLGAGLVAGYFALQGRVSFIPRASGNSTLSFSPEVDSKQNGKFFKITVSANVPRNIKVAKVVVLYDDKYLGAIKNIEVNKGFGTVSVDKKTKGRILVHAISTAGTVSKNSVLFSFQIKGEKVTPEAGTKLSVLLKKSNISDKDKKEMLDESAPIEATIKVLSEGTAVKPPTCSGLTLTPSLGTVGQEITARLVTTATDKALKDITFIYGSDGTQTIAAGNDGKHTFTTAGTYTVDGKVTDVAGNTSEACSQTIEISAVGQTPLPICTNLSVSPSSGIKTGNQVNALVVGTAGTGATLVKYTVDFDDGDSSVVTQTSLPIVHTYQTAGTYLLTASVTDSKNQVSIQVCTKSIEVTTTDNNDDGDDNDEDNSSPEGTDALDCDNNGAINILDFSCFRNDYGKQKNASGEWE